MGFQALRLLFHYQQMPRARIFTYMFFRSRPGTAPQRVPGNRPVSAYIVEMTMCPGVALRRCRLLALLVDSTPGE